MHGDGLANDKAIGDELADGLARVGVGNLVALVRVEPDLALATVGHRRREALLSTEVHPVHTLRSVCCVLRVPSSYRGEG